MKISVFFEHVLSAVQQESLPMPAVLKKIKALGYDGLEGYDASFLPLLPKLALPIRDTGLEIPSLYTFLRFEQGYDADAILRLLDALPAVPCKRLMVIPGVFTEKSRHEWELARFVDGLSFVCEKAGERGIFVSIENFGNPASPCFRTQGLLHLLRQVPSLQYTFDMGNFFFAEEDALEAFHQLKDRLGHVHLKDHSAVPLQAGEQPEMIHGKTVYPCPIGSGFLPVLSYIQAVRETGYDDFLSVEQFGCLHQLHAMESSIRFIKSALNS